MSKHNKSFFKRFIAELEARVNCFGIYCYVCKKTGEVVYIGRDSHIDRGARHMDHLVPSKASRSDARFQPLHEWLASNPDGWEYMILVPFIINRDLSKVIESALIAEYKPKFNVLSRKEKRT